MDSDGLVSPLDVLLVINYLNQGLTEVTNVPPPTYLDVNSNNFVDPLDALTIINDINSHSGGEGENSIATPWLGLESDAKMKVQNPFKHSHQAIDNYFCSYA